MARPAKGCIDFDRDQNADHANWETGRQRQDPRPRLRDRGTADHGSNGRCLAIIRHDARAR